MSETVYASLRVWPLKPTLDPSPYASRRAVEQLLSELAAGNAVRVLADNHDMTTQDVTSPLGRPYVRDGNFEDSVGQRRCSCAVWRSAVFPSMAASKKPKVTIPIREQAAGRVR